MIGRIDEVQRDPVWKGLIIGALYGVLARAYGGEACFAREDPGCTLKMSALSAGVGALIDYGIDDERIVYKAPKPTITLLRMSFFRVSIKHSSAPYRNGPYSSCK